MSDYLPPNPPHIPSMEVDVARLQALGFSNPSEADARVARALIVAGCLAKDVPDIAAILLHYGVALARRVMQRAPEAASDLPRCMDAASRQDREWAQEYAKSLQGEVSVSLVAGDPVAWSSLAAALINLGMGVSADSEAFAAALIEEGVKGCDPSPAPRLFVPTIASGLRHIIAPKSMSAVMATASRRGTGCMSSDASVLAHPFDPGRAIRSCCSALWRQRSCAAYRGVRSLDDWFWSNERMDIIAHALQFPFSPRNGRWRDGGWRETETS